MRISDWSSDVCSSDLLGHVLQDLARHGTEVGATVAANLGFIAHTTQSHAYKLSIGCARNGLPQRGLAHAGRPYQAQDRCFELVDALLYSQVFDNALFDFFEPIMIGIEHLFGIRNRAVDTAFFSPGHTDKGVRSEERRVGKEWVS